MRKTLTIWAMLCGVALCSCNKAADFSYEDIENADTLTHHAKYLTIADCGAGVVRVDIANPWRENHILASYALVDRDSLVPENLAPDIRVIRTPVDRAAVFSSVHTHALQELGALPSVVAIADREFFTPSDTVSKLIAQGQIIDLGPISSPSVELMAASGVTTVLRSPRGCCGYISGECCCS